MSNVVIERVKDISLTDLKLNCGIYGQSGTGKTMLAATFPEVCFVDCNGGLLSVRHTSARRISCPPQAGHLWMNSIQEAVNKISADTTIESIAIDGMSEVGTAGMGFVQYQNGTIGKNPNYDDWSAFFRIIEDFTVFVKSMKKHCIFICHETTERDELLGKVWVHPAIQGRQKGYFPSYFDEFYHAEVDQTVDGEYRYRLLARPTPIYVAKSRLLRDTSTAYIDDPSFSTLFKMISS